MLYNITDYTIIANALYAKQDKFMTYDEFHNYKGFLHQEITKKHKFIMYQDTPEHIKEYTTNLFVRTDDGIISSNLVDEKLIDYVLKGYPDDIKESFRISRNKYAASMEKTKTITKTPLRAWPKPMK